MDYPSFKIWWDEKDQIIRQIPKGINTLEMAQKVVTELFALLEQHPGAGLLVDGTDVPALTQQAGEFFQANFMDPRLKKVAFLNSSPATKFDIDYLAHTHPQAAAVLKKFDLFEDEEKAVKWLQQP